MIPAKISPLSPAWLPDVRAVVSGFVVGILGGASLATTREWLLSRCPEFRERFGHGYDFQRLVEGVAEFLEKHPGARVKIRLDDAELLRVVRGLGPGERERE